MKRREFSIGALAAAGLFAGAAHGAEGRMQGDSAPVQLWVPGLGPVLVTGIYLGHGRGIAFQGGAALFDEARADFSGAGPFAGLFRTPFARRWAQATPLGEVRFVEGTLVADIAAQGLAGQRVTLGGDGVSWDLAGVITAMAPVPAAGPVIGALGQEAGGRLLIHVPARAW
jgi:hypothetical protein